MCSICGIFCPGGITPSDARLVCEMGGTMVCRGPDATGEYTSRLLALSHNRLAVMDPERGAQPMTVCLGRRRYTVIYNGELYNLPTLRGELRAAGIALSTRCDTEALVYAYALYGEECLSHLSGIFAFAVWDHENESLFLARDPLGVKPLYFSEKNGTFLFASEPKALLKHPMISPTVDTFGLWQLLYLAPVTLPGTSVFRDISSLLPGECMTVDRGGIRRRQYFRLRAEPCRESREEAILHVRSLVRDAVRSQSVADVPLCSFLSGGLDSSAVSAILGESMHERGERLSTYSFEYHGNAYAPTLFQPNPDDAYAHLAAEAIGSEHTVLTLSPSDVAGALAEAALVRDFPGQADIDSSLLVYCRRVRGRHTVALSGECADEIFGGYPWFYRPEMLSRDFFPWIHDPTARISLFRSDLTRAEEGMDYLRACYRDAVSGVECLDGDSPAMRQSRIASVLSQRFFMQSLLERKDRMSMASGLEVRVPFSDPRIASYVYNLPWELKFEGGVEKSLLREAMTPYLPPEILWRKKSPYPKTHNPLYEARVREMLSERLSRDTSPLSNLIDRSALDTLLESRGDLTWQGQLMSRPQLLAWLYQFDVWAEYLGVKFAL